MKIGQEFQGPKFVKVEKACAGLKGSLQYPFYVAMLKD